MCSVCFLRPRFCTAYMIGYRLNGKSNVNDQEKNYTSEKQKKKKSRTRKTWIDNTTYIFRLFIRQHTVAWSRRRKYTNEFAGTRAHHRNIVMTFQRRRNYIFPEPWRGEGASRLCEWLFMLLVSLLFYLSVNLRCPFQSADWHQKP